jgi:hypothetical protein
MLMRPAWLLGGLCAAISVAGCGNAGSVTQARSTTTQRPAVSTPAAKRATSCTLLANRLMQRIAARGSQGPLGLADANTALTRAGCHLQVRLVTGHSKRLTGKP